MKKILIGICLFLFGSTFIQDVQAQTLPRGSCGIVYTYDAAGNRTKREYLCNNFTGPKDSAIDMTAATGIIQVDVLYPNPTTGYFTVKLFKPVNKATVTITDGKGQTILKKVESGNVLSYDLSRYPSGEYYLIIDDGKNSVPMKIIKSK